MFKKALFVAAILLCPQTHAYAAARTEIVLPSQLTSTSVRYKKSGRNTNALVYCLGKTPGSAKNTSAGLLFTPYSVAVSKLKAKGIRGAKLDTAVALRRAGTTACAHIGSGTPSLTPTPTATPNLGNTNFDSSGNVTPKGMVVFGIPSSLSGNITAGKNIVQSYCSCHSDKNGLSFNSLRSAIALSPMFFDSTQVADPMLANITAYLNRFRL